MLPVATAPGNTTSLVDALFTATSAVCVTGLVVVDTAEHWTTFGHVVILALIQLGGFGFMTSSILLFMLLGQRIRLRQQVLMREALNLSGIGGIVGITRNIAIWTILVEALGILALSLYFAQNNDPSRAFWLGLFHGISAFNNAGFDLMGSFSSLTNFRREEFLLIVIGALVVLGSTGYVLFQDVGKSRRWVRFSLETKLILIVTGALWLIGGLAFFWRERTNPLTLAGEVWHVQLVDTFFHSIAARTAGFVTIPVGNMTEDTTFLTMVLMLIGGAPGSTAGGIKVTTFAVLVVTILAVMRGRMRTTILRRKIPQEVVFRSLAIISLAVLLLIAVSWLLADFEPFGFLPVLFEAASALGTVGMSYGITPQLHDASRLVLVIAMFIGRLGPLTLILLLAQKHYRDHLEYPSETVRVG
ncbi:MAG: Trk family potassium uptake protein [Chloroflexota bacterium]|nr:Trk family potassium uptake protein [Chloroflexota bacterium]MDE2929947.1 Trk family potassium uptake protein [Chloroflexota bacterium]